MSKNKTVVRNEKYQKKEFNVRERHNERKNINYQNGDIIKDRSHMNVHFKKCPTTYEQEFDRMVKDKEISLRGLKKDANVFDELVFDVNTAYFENNGGYDYAKKFFEQAYELALKEIGGEQYILSAVMHADEKNVALSKELGKDVFHYHLHVIYVPVVDKEVKWSTRCKDPELVGKVKEVIKQVSHSKKWPRIDMEDGWVNSYSVLQNNFYEHMKNAGFKDFVRGERGSTAKHLSVTEYKISRDEQKLEQLNKTIEQKEKRVTGLDNKLNVLVKASYDFDTIEKMGRKSKTGKIIVEPKDWKRILSLCKEGVLSRGLIPRYEQKLERAKKDAQGYKLRWEKVLEDTKEYREAYIKAPIEVMESIRSAVKNFIPLKSIRTEHKQKKNLFEL